MRDPLLRFLLLAALSGCTLYRAPELTDCQLRCTPDVGCPGRESCVDGFCRSGESDVPCPCLHPEVTTLAPQVAGDWSFLGSDAGFALVYSRPSGEGDELVVARFDHALQRLGEQSLGVLPSPRFSAASAGDDLWVAWTTDGGLGLTRVGADGTVTPAAPLVGMAEASERPQVHVGDRVRVAFYALEGAQVRVASWSLEGDGGSWAVLNADDGGVFSIDNYGLELSSGGAFTAFTTVDSRDDDGGTVEGRFVVRNADGRRWPAQYFGDEVGALLDTGNTVGAVFTYAAAAQGLTSGVRWQPDVTGTTNFIDVTISTKPSTYVDNQDIGGFAPAALLTPKGRLVAAYFNYDESSVQLSASTLQVDGMLHFPDPVTVTTKAGPPGLAATAGGSMYGVSWRGLESGRIDAVMTCLP